MRGPLRCAGMVLAAVLLCNSAPAQVPPGQPSPRAGVTVSDEARRQFNVGVQLLDDEAGPRFAEAYDAFRRAYAASPSPLILSNLGLCAMRLERDGEAISVYERYLREVRDMSDEERQRIESDLRALRARSGTLIIRAQPAAGILVDRRLSATGHPAVNRYQVERGLITLVVHAGQHEIYLEGAETASPATAIVVGPGERESLTLALPPSVEPVTPAALPPGEGLAGLTMPTIVLLGITGALGAVTIGTGVAALESQSDYEAALDEERRADAVGVRQRGVILNGVTDGFMVGTIVTGSVALGFLIRDAVLISRNRGPAVSTGFGVGPDGAGVAVRGRF